MSKQTTNYEILKSLKTDVRVGGGVRSSTIDKHSTPNHRFIYHTGTCIHLQPHSYMYMYMYICTQLLRIIH